MKSLKVKSSRKASPGESFTRFCAQIYSCLGRILGIINSSMKIILSRTCKIHPEITQLDQELYDGHPELVELAYKILKKYMNFSEIHLFLNITFRWISVRKSHISQPLMYFSQVVNLNSFL